MVSQLMCYNLEWVRGAYWQDTRFREGTMNGKYFYRQWQITRFIEALTLICIAGGRFRGTFLNRTYGHLANTCLSIHYSLYACIISG
jgi:hypothetical protein